MKCEVMIMASIALGLFWLVSFQVLWYGYKLQKEIDNENDRDNDRIYKGKRRR